MFMKTLCLLLAARLADGVGCDSSFPHPWLSQPWVEDSSSLLQLSTAARKGATARMSPMRPKAQWEEPLSAEEEAEFERDMRMPIKEWLRENRDLNSDYFVKFGIPRGYWELMFWRGTHGVTDYTKTATMGAASWFSWPGYLGAGKGPAVTLNIEGTNITSRHVDHPSYMPDDAYCWTFGWLRGQGLDGSLMSNKSAWDALTVRECNKIGQALAGHFPEENHTVLRHVLWNRIWPGGLQCNVVAGSAPLVSLPGAEKDRTSCTPMTKNDMREHVYRKCLFGFAATEIAYCYTRGCLMNGNEIGHGAECSRDADGAAM